MNIIEMFLMPNFELPSVYISSNFLSKNKYLVVEGINKRLILKYDDNIKEIKGS